MTKVHAAQVTGLPTPPDWISPELQREKIWVLNAAVQLNEDGIAIQPSVSPYVWLGDICNTRPDLWQADPTTGQHMIADPRKKSTAVLPMNARAFTTLVSVLNKYYTNNFPAVLLLLGGYVLTVHYEALMAQQGSVPATLAYGDVQCGKSKATEAALSRMGMRSANFFVEVSDSRSFEFTSQTTLGMVIDDPDEMKQVAKKLTYHFQKSTASTKTYEYKPRTTFIVSMNKDTLQKLAKHARYVMMRLLKYV